MRKILSMLIGLLLPFSLFAKTNSNTNKEKTKSNLIKEIEEEFSKIEKNEEDGTTIQTGMASFYGGKWDGRKTANGEIFDMHSLTAAHKTLPFGTKVKITNVSNNKTVIVRINNRGPYSKGRIIDLSLGAFKQIENTSKGVTKVKLEVLK